MPPAAAGAPGWNRGREQADNCGLVGTEGRTRPWGPVLRSLWLGQAAARGRAGAPGPARPRVSWHRVRACAHVRGAAQCRPPSPQELLAEWQLRQGSRGVCGRLRRAALLALVWLLCLGITFGCTVAVYIFSELLVEVRGRARGLGVRTPAWVEWAPSDPSDPAATPGSGLWPRPLHGLGGPALCLPCICLTLSPGFFFFCCPSCFATPAARPAPFLCGLNLKPGVDASWGREALPASSPLLPLWDSSPQPPPAPGPGEDLALGMGSCGDRRPSPTPAEPRVCRAGGGAAGPAPGGLPPQPGGSLPVPLPGRPGAAQLPRDGGVRGRLQVCGWAGLGRGFLERSSQGTPSSASMPPPSTGTSSSRWSSWGFFATTGWAAGWAP